MRLHQLRAHDRNKADVIVCIDRDKNANIYIVKCRFPGLPSPGYVTDGEWLTFLKVSRARRKEPMNIIVVDA